MCSLQLEEISHQQVRVSLLEKKIENSTKEADDRVDKIQSKLDEAKKKEKLVVCLNWWICIQTHTYVHVCSF